MSKMSEEKVRILNCTRTRHFKHAIEFPKCPNLSSETLRKCKLIMEFSLPGIVQPIDSIAYWLNNIQYALVDEIKWLSGTHSGENLYKDYLFNQESYSIPNRPKKEGDFASEKDLLSASKTERKVWLNMERYKIWYWIRRQLTDRFEVVIRPIEQCYFSSSVSNPVTRALNASETSQVMECLFQMLPLYKALTRMIAEFLTADITLDDIGVRCMFVEYLNG